jgi:hypothetical protein
MAEFAILLYGPESGAQAGSVPDEAYDQHAEDIKRAGALIAAFALQPTTAAKSIRGDFLITDGPFAETKDVIAGFCVIEAPDLDAALAIARRNPILQEGGGVEVRPVAGWQAAPPGSGAGPAAGL